MNKWFCYILKNDTYLNKTYNGSTNNMVRRLRQHNGELVGGAKYTKQFGSNNWNVYFLMTGFPDHQNCLQAEFKIKYPNSKKPRPKKYNGYEGRILGVNFMLKLDKWNANSIVYNSTINYEIWIIKEYAHLLVDYPSNIKINIVDGEYINLGEIGL
jgi:predicted GIY-YIG superfamily endonuclease